jgi:hypothetical protein
MAKTPNAPANMSFLFTGRKFLEATRSPGCATLAYGGRFAAITIVDSTAPSVPQSVLATATSSSQINLSWNASTDTGGSGLQGYRVYRNGSNTPLVSQAGTTYSDTGLTASTLYSYEVSAYDVQGNESAHSTVASATTQSDVVAGAPLILYTDIVSGPTSGGENNLGWYLSIFGTGFGTQGALGTTTKVFIGGVEVANYRALVNARNSAVFSPAIQQIMVQIGALGGAAAGSVLAIKVVVDGVDSNTDKTFTVQPGPIIFVDEASPTSSDSNSGAIAAPKKNMQTTSGGIPTGGALNTSTIPGTCICLRGGAYSSNLGKDASWFRVWRITGAPPTGAASRGYINITAYPGPILGHAPEVPHYTSQANTGGIRGNDSARAGEPTPYGFTGYSQYIAISNLWIQIASNGGVGAAPVNLESSANFWRVVNNELGPWPQTTLAQAAGVAGNGDSVKILGNYIHDIGGLTSQPENHGIYFDESVITAVRCEAAWNYIKNINAGTGMQCYSAYGDPFIDIEFHHNWIENTRKYGMAFSDYSKSIRAYNNVIKDSGVYSLYINTAISGLACSFVNNTVYNSYATYSGGPNGMVVNNWNATSGYVEIAHNIWVMGSGRANNSLTWFDDNGSGSAIVWRRNLYFDPKGLTTTKYSGDSTGLYGNPIFRTSYTDFRISVGSGSPAINAGTGSVNLSVTTDADNHVRPSSGNANKSIGAYEPA